MSYAITTCAVSGKIADKYFIYDENYLRISSTNFNFREYYYSFFFLSRVGIVICHLSHCDAMSHCSLASGFRLPSIEHSPWIERVSCCFISFRCIIYGRYRKHCISLVLISLVKLFGVTQSRLWVARLGRN